MHIGVVELLILLVVVVAPILLIGVLVTVALVTHRSSPSPALTRERRLVTLVRLAGGVLGIALAIVLSTSQVIAGYDLRYGRGPMLAPVAFGVATLLGIIAGELLARPAPAAGPRQASLTTRRVRDHLPAGYAAAVLAVIGLGVAVLILTTLTASPDDVGRAGRALAHSCSSVQWSMRTPYPGGFYSLPLLLGLALSVGAAAYAARQVVLRPRGGAPDAGDDALRRRSLSAVAGGLGIAVAAPVAGVSLIAGMALLGIDCRAGWFTPVGWLLLATSAASIVVFCWSIVILSTAGTAVREWAPVGAGR